jgi:hypothetical protein
VADTNDLQRLWSGLLTAYVDYWRSVGRLSANYVRAVTSVAGTAPNATDGSAEPMATAVARRPVNATMALEGTAGSKAVGMFVVENSGHERISGELAVPSLADADGREVRVSVAFDPPQLTLEPGEQTVVQTSVTIGRSLVSGRDYRGEVRVPGLAGTSIPIVVRRLPAASSSGSASG